MRRTNVGIQELTVGQQWIVAVWCTSVQDVLGVLSTLTGQLCSWLKQLGMATASSTCRIVRL